MLWLFHLAQCTNHRYVRNPANKLLLIGWLIRDAIRFKLKTFISGARTVGVPLKPQAASVDSDFSGS